MFSFLIGFVFAVMLMIWIVGMLGYGFLFVAKTAPQQLGELSDRVINALKKGTNTK